MNITENTIEASQNKHRISFPNVASAISALLLCSCASYSDEHQTAGTDAVYNPLPYRPLSEFGKGISYSIDLEELKKSDQLRSMMSSLSDSSQEEFVDDEGNIYTREQLESSNQ